MHFHLPKPRGGWREFSGEVGIIVLGVLIALGAGQLAEAMNNRADAEDARREINAEVVTDITRIHQRGFAYECVDARLAEIDRIVDAAGDDGKIQRPSWIGRPPHYAIETARWDAASQSGRISRLPPDWQGQFGFIYTALHHFLDLNSAEQQVWSWLEGLSGVDRLTPDGRLAIKSLVAEARYDNFSIQQVSNIIFGRAAQFGLRPTKRHDPPFGACWPMTMSAAQGQRMIALRDAREQRPPGL
jgi:hypothetical protein